MPLRQSTTQGAEHEDLYKYTSGRWLFGEEQQLAQRYVKFDIGKLCRLASSLLDENTSCIRVDKLEGKFNRAFLLTMDNGCELIAKLPYAIAGSAFFATASEVATLKFLRQSTSLPVANVLAWNSDSSNEIGSEYIIMEKIPGVGLEKKWEGLSSLQRYSIIEKVVMMEKELASLEFPAYGALYLRDSVPAHLKHYALPHAPGRAESFCVGPSYDAHPNHDCVENFRESSAFGPSSSLGGFASFSAQLETNAMNTCQDNKNKSQSMMQDQLEVSKESQNLQAKASTILPILSSDCRVLNVSRPALWHTGLPLDNILVSETDPTQILGLIGWRSSQILPLFLHARFPKFLATPKMHNFGDQLPSLSGFAELSPEQQKRALQIQDIVARSQYYEMSIAHYSDLIHEAMCLDRNLSQLFQCRELSSASGLLHLRNHLISISTNWASLGLPGDCPFTFTPEQLVQHERQYAQYQDAQKLREAVTDQLSTDEEGWVSAQRWAETDQQNRILFNKHTESVKNLSHDKASSAWPFPPLDS